jgi:hypothetical protein
MLNKEIPEDTYLYDVLYVSIEIGKAPTTTEYKSIGNFSPRSGRRKFGSWKATLGMVCSKVFGIRPSIDYMSHKYSNLEENRNETIRKKDFEEALGIKLKQFEWKAVIKNSDIGEDMEKKKENILDEFQTYYENFYSTEEFHKSILNMRDIFNTHPSEYIVYFSSHNEVRKYLEMVDFYKIQGRGTAEKLDEFIQIACSLERGDMMNIIDKGYSIEHARKIASKIDNSIPEIEEQNLL